jgi:hypothetical protein
MTLGMIDVDARTTIAYTMNRSVAATVSVKCPFTLSADFWKAPMTL